MAYSFTEKKRIRKDFGKLPEIMEIPYLLSIQVDSYSQFLQLNGSAEKRQDAGLHAAFRSVFPIVSYSGNAALEYVDYRLGDPRVRREGVRVARHHLRRAAARSVRLIIYDRESRVEGGEGRERAGSVHGRNSAHDRERYVRHQRHRARRRFAAAPFARRVLRPRPRQDALVREAAVQRSRDSLPRLVARLRIRSEGLCVRAYRPSSQVAGDDSAARARVHVRTNARRCSSRRISST